MILQEKDDNFNQAPSLTRRPLKVVRGKQAAAAAHLSVPAFKHHSKRSVSDQLLPTELKLPHRLHVVADFTLLRDGLLNRRLQDWAAAGESGFSATIHGLPS